MENKILIGNVLEKLKEIKTESVHCIITSPPYWNLRKYDVPDTNITDNFYGQLGQEKSPVEFVNNLVFIFNEMSRILRNDGILWVNIGDSYKNKSLCMIPAKFAIEMNKLGWYIRSDNIYARATPMPESVKDRFIRSHEFIFMLTKSDKYYYDWFNGRENAQTNGIRRNKRTVMTIMHGRYHGNHFASFGKSLVEPLIAVSTSDYGCCANCGAQYGRIYDKETIWRSKSSHARYRVIVDNGQPDQGKLGVDLVHKGWKKLCNCNTDKINPSVVLDPFCGTGTTALVAQNMGRNWLGIELSQEYVNQAYKRLGRIQFV